MEEITDTDKGCYTDHGVSGYGMAAKLSRKAPMDDVFVRKIAEEMMMSIAQKCMAAGARAIGHIKSHIRTEAGTVKADTIGVDHGSFSTGNFDYPVSEIYLAVNSIVAGIPETQVRDATLDGIHEIAEVEGVSVLKEKEHTYFDEFDFVESKQDFIKQLEAQFDGQDLED